MFKVEIYEFATLGKIISFRQQCQLEIFFKESLRFVFRLLEKPDDPGVNRVRQIESFTCNVANLFVLKKCQMHQPIKTKIVRRLLQKSFLFIFFWCRL